MNGLINFIKSLLGFENPQEIKIGLAQYNNNDTYLDDNPPEKNQKNQDLTLSQMLKRASY